MVVPKDSPITSAKDLNGKTLPTPSLRDIIETSTRAWMDANGAVYVVVVDMPLTEPAARHGALADIAAPTSA